MKIRNGVYRITGANGRQYTIEKTGVAEWCAYDERRVLVNMYQSLGSASKALCGITNRSAHLNAAKVRRVAEST